MPNQPDPNKRVLSCYISREYYAKARKFAEKKGLSLSQFISRLIEREVHNEKLEPEDYEQIAREMQEARSRQAR